MISSNRKTNCILPHAVLLISLLLSKGTDTARSRLYVKMSFSLLFGRCHLNTRITFLSRGSKWNAEMSNFSTQPGVRETSVLRAVSPRAGGGRLFSSRCVALTLSRNTHAKQALNEILALITVSPTCRTVICQGSLELLLISPRSIKLQLTNSAKKVMHYPLICYLSFKHFLIVSKINWLTKLFFKWKKQITCIRIGIAAAVSSMRRLMCMQQFFSLAKKSSFMSWHTICCISMVAVIHNLLLLLKITFSHYNHFHIFFICSFFLSSPCILCETGLISARQKQLRWRRISFGPCTVCSRAEFLAQMAARVRADWVRAILPALVSAWCHSFLIKWRTVNSSVTCSELQVCEQNTVNFCSCCPSEIVTSNTVFIIILFISKSYLHQYWSSKNRAALPFDIFLVMCLLLCTNTPKQIVCMWKYIWR